MIGLVGYQDEVIGFGLAGVAKAIELTRNATKEDVLEALSSFSKETKAVIINESLMDKIRDVYDDSIFIFIEIPETLETSSIEKLEALAKETLGISL